MREGFANVGLELSHGKMNARAPYIIVSTANETHLLVKAEATQKNVFLCCVKETTFFFFSRHGSNNTTTKTAARRSVSFVYYNKRRSVCFVHYNKTTVMSGSPVKGTVCTRGSNECETVKHSLVPLVRDAKTICCLRHRTGPHHLYIFKTRHLIP
ncbi:unnamed protein product [Pylaiella littoralis]